MNLQALPSPSGLNVTPENAGTDRILILDVLRGFALMGILLAHFANQFAAGMLPQAFYESIAGSPVDNVFLTITNIFVQGKFFTIFSFLFGLSFALQLELSRQKSGNFLGRYTWRLLILGIIGFIHHIHWRGDILTIYVILGFGLLLFHNLSDKLLLTIALLLVLNIPGRVTELYHSLTSSPDKARTEQEANERNAQADQYYQMIKQGSYTQMLKDNLAGFKDKMEFQVQSGRIYITLGLFLLGLYAGRRKFFENLLQHRPFFKKLFKYCGFATLALIAIAVLLFVIIQVPFENPFVALVGGLIYDFSGATLTFFYIAGVTLLFGRIKWNKILLHLAPVGRLALTTYIAQTVVGLFIFYHISGFGLALIGEIGGAVTILLTIPVFLLQILFSKWWLSKFQYGPLEWVWRSLTLLRIQPLVRPKQVNQPGAVV